VHAFLVSGAGFRVTHSNVRVRWKVRPNAESSVKRSAPRLETRLSRLVQGRNSEVLRANLFGLEKEGLRVAPDGGVATTPHPLSLGSALTHPYITTDFSEALLELITPPTARAGETLAWLADLHGFVHRHLGEELLWAASMPCLLAGAGSIPLAVYGSSNAARMKTIYRRGLGNRYGRTMQAIAGIHFNFSFADGFWPLYQDLEQDDTEAIHFCSESYMGMIRNLQRYGWLIPYLFGASPAVCASFAQGKETNLKAFDNETLYAPYATSLRMGDIGYQNRQTEGTGMKASYDSLDSYIRSLTWAIETPCPHYETLGVKVGDRYEQLNENVLQIENEYYSTIRPKQVTQWLEKPTHALRRRGVRYVELRSLDVDASQPLGLGEDQMHFLEIFMLWSLLLGSPRINAQERIEIDRNQVLAAHRGREPGLELERDGEAVVLRRWAAELLQTMEPVAGLLDGVRGGVCGASLREQQDKVADPDRTPSALMLAEMRIRGESFHAFARRLSEAHGRRWRSHELDPARDAELRGLVAASRERQAQIEAEDRVDFDTFLADYFAQQVDQAD
jgi:glutamate--cysteine ligase